MVNLYLQFCSVFGENVIYDWYQFMDMPLYVIHEIINQRSKINEEKMKRMEEIYNNKSKR